MNAVLAESVFPISFMRDGRYRSRMADEIKRVDCMLTEWARWGFGALRHLGVPREALISRVARFGFVGAAQSGAMPEWPPLVVLTESAVLRIQQIERSTITEEYGQPGADTDEHARRMHMSPTRYRKVLERARQSVRRELLTLSPHLDLSHSL